MKYCPYCGADILSGKVSFCSECGKSIKDRKTKTKSDKKLPEKKKNKTKDKPSADIHTEDEIAEEKSSETADDGYDGYYDDIIPDDGVVERQQLDKATVKNLIIIAVGVSLAITICVIAMYLM